MTPDPDQPWGIALDYMGRALEPVIEQGLPVTVWVADSEPDHRNTPTVNAQIVMLSPDFTMTAQLGMVSLPAYSGGMWAPSPATVQQAVEDCVQQAIDHLNWLAGLRPTAA